MANSQSQLPEGTDSIIPGAASESVVGDGPGFTSDTGYASSAGGARRESSDYSAAGSDEPKVSTAASGKLGDAATKVGEATAGLREQATDKALGFVSQGRDQAVGLLDNVTQLVDDAANQIDEKVGEQFGAYARQASQTVSGIADTLRDKDVEELVDEARQLVRKSPAIAIGAAAALGFVVARLLKVGLAESGGTNGTRDSYAADAPHTASVNPAPTPSTATTVPADTVF